MRQTLGFIAVWCVATVLAVSVAWFGVRDVLSSEVFDDASIEPISVAIGRTEDTRLAAGAPTGPQTVGVPTASPSKPARSPAPHPTPSTRETTRPQPVRSPSRTAAPVRILAAPAPPSPSVSRPTATRTGSISTGNLRVVNVKGGSVSFAIEEGVCRLIAAAPNAGYEAKVASATGWIRVDLVRGEHGSAVFCIGGENRTDLWEY